MALRRLGGEAQAVLALDEAVAALATEARRPIYTKCERFVPLDPQAARASGQHPARDPKPFMSRNIDRRRP